MYVKLDFTRRTVPICILSVLYIGTGKKQKKAIMKHSIFLFMFILQLSTLRLGLSAVSKNQLSSPIGPYQMVFKQAFNCNPTKNNKMKLNLHITNKGNLTLIQGNLTSEIPIDDTLFLEMKMALKDSFGRWKENAYVMKLQNACSTLKQLLGNIWTAFKVGAGFKNTDCPIPPGIYTAPGVDTSIFKGNNNFPKSFFYGTYKLYMYFSKDNEIFGCLAYIIDFKRP